MSTDELCREVRLTTRPVAQRRRFRRRASTKAGLMTSRSVGRARPTTIDLVVRVCVAVLAIVMLATGCTGGGSSKPPDASSTAVQRTLDPGSVEEAVEQYIARGSLSLKNIRSVVVSVDGTTEVAYYRTGRPNDRAHVFSVTKSVVSTLVGIALEQGILDDLDQDLRTLLPQYRSVMSAPVASITLEQLLTMTSGLPSTPPWEDPPLSTPDWVSDTLGKGVVARPGTSFIYSDQAADVLAAVLAAALKRHDGAHPRSLLDFARETLFDPLGIQTRPAYVGFEGAQPWSARFNDDGFAWATDRQGRNYGCCMLKLTTPDMVKLGELFLQGGRWKGRQLVPETWVRAATTPIPLEPIYGRMWWIEDIGIHHAFFADGRGGQLIAVVPDLKLVVAISSLLDVKDQTNINSRGEDLLPMVNDIVVSRLQ